jgi:hypothetical protein
MPRPAPGGDELALTIANADNNKLDAYLHETLHETIDYSPATGQAQETVTMTLTNTAPAGLPAYVAGSYPGSGIPAGTAREWVSLYTPFRVDGVQVDGSDS